MDFRSFFLPNTGRLVAELNDEWEFRVASNVVSISTNSPSMNVCSRRDNERFGNLPAGIRASNAGEDAIFK